MMDFRPVCCRAFLRELVLLIQRHELFALPSVDGLHRQATSFVSLCWAVLSLLRVCLEESLSARSLVLSLPAFSNCS